MMGFSSDTLRLVAATAAFGFMLAAAGCQSDDLKASQGPGQGSGGKGVAPSLAGVEKISSAELRAYCPKVALREGTAYFSTYAKAAKKKPAGPDDAAPDPADAAPDPGTVIYQAAVTDVTRSCTYAPGQMTINVAVAGKIVPGPQGTAGTIVMPIRIVVMSGTDVLYSKLHQYPVAVPDASSSVQFVFNDPDVVVPAPTVANYRVFAGYDEGPDKDKDKSRKVASAQ